MARGAAGRYTLSEALGNERTRDRADAKRQIEGLSQNEQIVGLLTDLLAEARENGRRMDRTNQLLEWIGSARRQA